MSAPDVAPVDVDAPPSYREFVSDDGGKQGFSLGLNVLWQNVTLPAAIPPPHYSLTLRLTARVPCAASCAVEMCARDALTFWILQDTLSRPLERSRKKGTHLWGKCHRKMRTCEKPKKLTYVPPPPSRLSSSVLCMCLNAPHRGSRPCWASGSSPPPPPTVGCWLLITSRAFFRRVVLPCASTRPDGVLKTA
jgi:hypothetical protein